MKLSDVYFKTVYYDIFTQNWIKIEDTMFNIYHGVG